MDVAPTALYALGVPLNEDMDGRPVADLFTLEFAAEHSVTFRPNEAAASTDRVDPFSAAEEDDIMDQLKGLGYIN